jgi:hypothetical protein
LQLSEQYNNTLRTGGRAMLCSLGRSTSSHRHLRRGPAFLRLTVPSMRALFRRCPLRCISIRRKIHFSASETSEDFLGKPATANRPGLPFPSKRILASFGKLLNLGGENLGVGGARFRGWFVTV